MTKLVRIENADSGFGHKVKLTFQVKNVGGEWVNADDPYLFLDRPTQEFEGYIHESRRILVEEYR